MYDEVTSDATADRAADPRDAVGDGAAARARHAQRPARREGEVARLRAELAERDARIAERDAELERSRLRFRDIIERNADAIVVVDQLGVIRFANAAAADLFRSTREALPGTPFGFPVVAGETTELDLLNDGPRVVEMRVVETEWEGQAAHIASLRDITERKQAEESARRLIREQTARAAAEASARRFRFLAEASATLSAPLDYTETLATLAKLCVTEAADWAVIYVVREDGVVMRLEVVHCDQQMADTARALREHPIRLDGTHPVREVLRTRAPLLVSETDESHMRRIATDDRHLELLRALGMTSYMCVPLVARDRVIGAIALVSTTPARHYTPDDLAQANDLALRAALAVDNARLYREAQRANQAKSDLLAVISHDLRTPLNSIIGHADLLALGVHENTTDGGAQWVERIRTAARHLLYLIDELLSFARLEAGREELRLQDVDARTIAADVAAVVDPLARERGVSFHLSVPEQPVDLNTDPDRVRQVLLNLVGNAIKYTERGSVHLELRAGNANEVVLAVRDTGIGIRPEHLDRIFEPFWQVDPQRRGASGGTGLGLGVVRGLLRLLGGEVTVASEPGRGSTFTVRLPRRTSE